MCVSLELLVACLNKFCIFFLFLIIAYCHCFFSLFVLHVVWAREFNEINVIIVVCNNIRSETAVRLIDVYTIDCDTSIYCCVLMSIFLYNFLINDSLHHVMSCLLLTLIL